MDLWLLVGVALATASALTALVVAAVLGTIGRSVSDLFDYEAATLMPVTRSTPVRRSTRR
jgi:hypothetical protein